MEMSWWSWLMVAIALAVTEGALVVALCRAATARRPEPMPLRARGPADYSEGGAPSELADRTVGGVRVAALVALVLVAVVAVALPGHLPSDRLEGNDPRRRGRRGRQPRDDARAGRRTAREASLPEPERVPRVREVPERLRRLSRYRDDAPAGAADRDLRREVLLPEAGSACTTRAQSASCEPAIETR